jgi:hypothetical protein
MTSAECANCGETDTTSPITTLLGIGDGQASHGRHCKGRVVVDGGESVDISGGQIAGVAGAEVLD